MLSRSPKSTPQPLNIVGSSTFGRYPKISIEKTYNMFISDSWLVDYAGYKVAIDAAMLGDQGEGRAIHASTKFNCLIIVVGANVYRVKIGFNQQQLKVTNTQVALIGTLNSNSGVVYITENNKPQILISDGQTLYLYDPTFALDFQELSVYFVPGYVDFHDTYFLIAASSNSFYNPPANNTWIIQPILEESGGKAVFLPADASTIGLLETKPDNTQAVVRFPSKGNLIFVFGRTVTEAWYDVGAQLFPYQRNSSYTLDYGCINPATIGSIDSLIVWLGINEKSGPVILYSDGGMPQKISTDGIDYFLGNLQTPEDSQGFLFRQDGHILYHINFYSDNVSLFYDFNTQKFFFATDENMNYFIASSLSFFGTQYYFVSKNDGNLYVFDTVFSDYNGKVIPRIRTCKNLMVPTQDYFVTTDVGFTIESGETNFINQDAGPVYLITEDGKKLITDGGVINFITENGDFLLTEDEQNLISQQASDEFSYLIGEQNYIIYETPRVDFSISTDGGQHFSSYVSYDMPSIGIRRNKLMWWQIGVSNSLTCQFRFYGFGRFLATDGVINIRL